MIYDNNSRVYIRANAIYDPEQCFGTASMRIEYTLDMPLYKKRNGK
jgi:hypothetical protein